MQKKNIPPKSRKPYVDQDDPFEKYQKGKGHQKMQNLDISKLSLSPTLLSSFLCFQCKKHNPVMYNTQLCQHLICEDCRNKKIAKKSKFICKLFCLHRLAIELLRDPELENYLHGVSSELEFDYEYIICDHCSLGIKKDGINNHKCNLLK